MLSHLVNYYIQDKMASFIILTTKYIGNNMKTKLSIILLIVIRAQLLVGQNWDNTYGYDDKGDIGNSVVKTNDDGYIAFGTSSWWENEDTESEFFTSDLFLVKVDSLGQEQWIRSFDDTNSTDEGNSIQQTIDGGYILTGSTYSDSSLYDGWLIKTDSNGNILWDYKYGGDGDDFFNDIQETNDGGYIMAGGSSGALWLMKTNSMGEEEWSRTHKWDNGYDEAFSVKQTFDDGFILTGRTGSSSVYPCLWLLKTDSLGQEEWNDVWGENTNTWEFGTSVIQTPDSGYVISGWVDDGDIGDGDIWLIKTDSLGQEEWLRVHGTTYREESSEVIATDDGGYAVIGNTWGFQDEWGNYRLASFLLKINSQGFEEWTMSHNTGQGEIFGRSIKQTNDGGYIISSNHSGDLWLIKTDQNGQLKTINDNAFFPEILSLFQNYPNPFNPTTTLKYDLPEDALVNITIYDMMGRVVKTMVNSQQNAGFKSVRWNATNDKGQPVSAGLYLYTIQAGEFRQTKKMVLLK